MSEATIIDGNEDEAAQLAELWFPRIWYETPGALQSDLYKEVYVLLFRLQNMPLVDRPRRNALHEAMVEEYPEAASAAAMTSGRLSSVNFLTAFARPSMFLTRSGYPLAESSLPVSAWLPRSNEVTIGSNSSTSK